jgi:hypothetical protein
MMASLVCPFGATGNSDADSYAESKCRDASASRRFAVSYQMLQRRLLAKRRNVAENDARPMRTGTLALNPHNPSRCRNEIGDTFRPIALFSPMIR